MFPFLYIRVSFLQIFVRKNVTTQMSICPRPVDLKPRRDFLSKNHHSFSKTEFLRSHIPRKSDIVQETCGHSFMPTYSVQKIRISIP